jgi:YfiH family protein
MTDTLLKYNLGAGVEAFTARRDAVLPYPVIQGHQVHNCKVAVIDRPGLTREDLEGYDAFVTNLPGVAIGVRTADCVPILLYDPVKRVIAAVHAGWKGTVLRISQNALEVMAFKFGSSAADIKAVIGPAIGPDSFQVGIEVAEKFKHAGFPMDYVWSFHGAGDGTPMSGGHHIDLFKANRWLLEQAGVIPDNIQVFDIDTFTATEFFSARREGAQCGRNINSIKLLP